MKFTINTAEFSKVVLAATRILPSSSKNPVALFVKLDLTQNGLTVTTSNEEISQQTLIPFFKADKEIIRDYTVGSCLIEGRFLSEVVKRTESEEITFEVVDDSMMKIEAESAIYNTLILRAEEYYNLDFSLSGIKVDISGQDLLDAINQVSFAASVKNTRPTLMGVNIECNSTRLIFTATDGARLAKKEVMTDTEDVFNVTVPSKSLQEVAKSIEGEESVEVFTNDKRVLFMFGNTIITTAFFAEAYPNVKNIIPRNFYYSLEVNSHDLLRALDKVGFISNDRDRIARLIMTENNIDVVSKSQRGENASDKLNLFRYVGDRLEISFNIDFVAQAVRALRSEDVLIQFIGEMKPFLIVDKNNPSIIQLITPIRTY